MVKKVLEVALLELIPRIVSMATLWTFLSVSVSKLLSSPITTLITNLVNIRSILQLLCLAVGIGAIVTASPLLYASTIFIHILAAFPNITVGSIVIGVTGLVIILLLDTIRSTYRRRQLTRYTLSKKSIAFAASISVSLILLCIVLSNSVNAWLTYFFDSMVAVPNNILAMLGENLVFKTIVALVIIVISILLLSNFFETLALFAYPSKRIALQSLVREEGILVMFSEPLRWLRTLILASLLAPPLYALVQYGILPLIVVYVSELYMYLQNKFAKLAIEIAMLILSAILVRKYLDRLFLEPAKAIRIVAGIAVSMYIVASLLTYVNTGDLMYSFTHPSIKALGYAMARVYIGFYVEFIYILNDLVRALGAAP